MLRNRLRTRRLISSLAIVVAVCTAEAKSVRQTHGVSAQLLRQAVQENPNDAQAWRTLALYLAEKVGINDEAIAAFDNYLALGRVVDRGAGAGAMWFIQSELIANRRPEAIRAIERLWGLSKDWKGFDRCYFFSSLDVKVLGEDLWANRMDKLKPYCSNYDHYKRATDLLATANRTAAIGELQQQIQTNPAFAQTYVSLARLLRDEHRQQDADNVLRRLLQSDDVDNVEKCLGIKDTSESEWARLVEAPTAQAVQRMCSELGMRGKE